MDAAPASACISMLAACWRPLTTVQEGGAATLPRAMACLPLLPADPAAVHLIVCSATLLALLTSIAVAWLPAPACAALLATLLLTVLALRRGRWKALRCHRWEWVRYCQQSLSIYYFSWRLDRACAQLPPPIDALGVLEGGTQVLEEILATGPNTYQKKPTNRAQIESLLDCVCELVPGVQRALSAVGGGSGSKPSGKPPLVLDLGAGKALLTRAVYEALDRRVACVALDSRHHRPSDRFYDPPAPDWSGHVTVIRPTAAPVASAAEQPSPPPPQQQQQQAGTPVATGMAPYMRVVADVTNGRQLHARLKLPLAETTHGGVIALSKHLCGGATDCSLKALCAPPLGPYVGASCIAPCCHQKIRRKEYCNMSFLREMGFCTEHVGVRGGLQDIDFRTLGMVIQMSKCGSGSGSKRTELHAWEFKKSPLLQVCHVPLFSSTPGSHILLAD